MEEFSSNSGGHFPFKKNPLGRPLLRNTIDHYKKLGDIQMVAMLASVFAQTFPEQHLCQLVKNVDLTVAEKSNSLHFPRYSIITAGIGLESHMD